MLPHGLAYLPADRQHRIERSHRILEDHGDRTAAQTTQCLGIEPGEVSAGE